MHVIANRTGMIPASLAAFNKNAGMRGLNRKGTCIPYGGASLVFY